MNSKINFRFQISEFSLTIEKLNFEENTDIKAGTGVSQDGNIVIIYISSYCSFSVDWLIC